MRLLVDLGPLRSSPAFRRLWIGTTFSTVGGQLAVVAVLYGLRRFTTAGMSAKPPSCHQTS